MTRERCPIPLGALFYAAMECRRKSAVSIASRKLKSTKENVEEQLKNVAEYLLSLNASKSNLELECQFVKERLENEVELTVNALRTRKVQLLQELEEERIERSKVISKSAVC